MPTVIVLVGVAYGTTCLIIFTCSSSQGDPKQFDSFLNDPCIRTIVSGCSLT